MTADPAIAPPKHAWSRAQLFAKSPAEVGWIIESAIECKVQNLLPPGREPNGRLSQSHASNILVRRHARDLLKDPEKMVRTQARFARQPGERQGCPEMVFDRSDHVGDPCNGTRQRRTRAGGNCIGE